MSISGMEYATHFRMKKHKYASTLPNSAVYHQKNDGCYGLFDSLGDLCACEWPKTYALRGTFFSFNLDNLPSRSMKLEVPTCRLVESQELINMWPQYSSKFVPFWAQIVAAFSTGPTWRSRWTWRLTVTELRQRLAPDARLVLAGCYANDGYTMTLCASWELRGVQMITCTILGASAQLVVIVVMTHFFWVNHPYWANFSKPGLWHKFT